MKSLIANNARVSLDTMRMNLERRTAPAWPRRPQAGRSRRELPPPPLAVRQEGTPVDTPDALIAR